MPSNRSYKSRFCSPIIEPPVQPDSIGTQCVMGLFSTEIHVLVYVCVCALLLSHLCYINLLVCVPDPRRNHNIQAFFFQKDRKESLVVKILHGLCAQK